MTQEYDAPYGERAIWAFFAGITGSGYGALLCGAVFLVTGNFHSNIIAWSAGVFALIGSIYGNFAGEAFLTLIHFLWGLISGVTESPDALNQVHANGHLRNFMLVGFGIGLVIFLWVTFD